MIVYMDPRHFRKESFECEQICKELMKSIYKTNPKPKPVNNPKPPNKPNIHEPLTELQELLIFWGP